MVILVDHDDLIMNFIESGLSPVGKWYLNVPVGLENARRIAKDNQGNFFGTSERKLRKFISNSCKKLDALCITSKKPKNTVENPRVKKPEHYHHVSSNDFDNEHIVLIEAKTNSERLYKGIGQLYVYESLFKEDWNPLSVKKILLTTKVDNLIQKSTKGLDINYVKMDQEGEEGEVKDKKTLKEAKKEFKEWKKEDKTNNGPKGIKR